MTDCNFNIVRCPYNGPVCEVSCRLMLKKFRQEGRTLSRPINKLRSNLYCLFHVKTPQVIQVQQQNSNTNSKYHLHALQTMFSHVYIKESITSNIITLSRSIKIAHGTVCVCIERYVYTHTTHVEQSLTSHQTHYRSCRGRVFTSQMTQPTVSKH